MSAPGAEALLELQNLSFAYPEQPPLVSSWSATIGPGVTWLQGDTGSGKSTVLRLLAGRLRGRGRLTLAGTRVDDACTDADFATYRRHVFLCDPATDAFDQVTARACTAALSAGDPGFDVAAWQIVVEGFALTPHLDKPVYMLSTGTRRKLWLAAALASGRALVLLDEPTGALDASSIGCLRNALLRAAARADRAVVVASAEPMNHVPPAAIIELPLS
jgi:ABC-type multidrug transport system ATPase subunit